MFTLEAPGERTAWHGYRLAVLDPPWDTDTGGGGRGAQSHYPVEDWCAILRAVIECRHWVLDPRGAHVWIWYTSLSRELVGKLGEALGLVDTGTERVWHKGRLEVVDGEAVLVQHCGLGQRLRYCHEYARLFTLGRDVGVPTSLRRPSVLLEPARGGALTHSHKPDAFYADAWASAQCDREQHGRAPALELFARRPRAGWWVWGNEITTAGEAGEVCCG